MEEQYLDILEELIHAPSYPNRTGTDAKKIPPKQLQHDMSLGFPILTTKKVAWKSVKVELEGFIKGITSKKWFNDRGCTIWNEWCNPQKVPYGNDPETHKKMATEDDLGPCIYGAAWRGFHDPTAIDLKKTLYPQDGKLVEVDLSPQKIDQFDNIVNTLKTNPTDRRMICMAWNPLGLKHTALPPCHFSFQVTTRGNFLDLTWNQRSCDMFLGVPFNIASYALLLELFCMETGFTPGILTGNLTDVHLYVNHFDQAIEQVSRDPYDLPKLKIENWNGIYNWTHDDAVLDDYKCHPTIKAPVAI